MVPPGAEGRNCIVLHRYVRATIQLEQTTKFCSLVVLLPDRLLLKQPRCERSPAVQQRFRFITRQKMSPVRYDLTVGSKKNVITETQLLEFSTLLNFFSTPRERFCEDRQSEEKAVVTSLPVTIDAASRGTFTVLRYRTSSSGVFVSCIPLEKSVFFKRGFPKNLKRSFRLRHVFLRITWSAGHGALPREMLRAGESEAGRIKNGRFSSFVNSRTDSCSSVEIPTTFPRRWTARQTIHTLSSASLTSASQSSR